MELGITSFLTDRAMAPAALARAVEERGFSSLFLPEHTHFPLRQDSPPAVVEGVRIDDYRRSLDPLVALASAAAVTTRIRLGTGVLLVAQHDPVVLAKQLATLDQLSDGRVVLGVGYGWNRAEAEDHGIEFSERRRIAHEKIACIAALGGDDPVEFHGKAVDLPACWFSPKPIQKPRIPVLFGGAAGPKLFEAIAGLGDGWMPIGGRGLEEEIPRLEQAAALAGREKRALKVVPFGVIPEAGKLDHYRNLGVAEVVLRLPSGPAGEMERALDGFVRYLPGD